MTNQLKHIRTSKFGKKYFAGSRVEVDTDEPLKDNILESENEIEIPETDVEKIRAATGLDDETILTKVADLGTSDINQIIQALKEPEED